MEGVTENCFVSATVIFDLFFLSSYRSHFSCRLEREASLQELSSLHGLAAPHDILSVLWGCQEQVVAIP